MTVLFAFVFACTGEPAPVEVPAAPPVVEVPVVAPPVAAPPVEVPPVAVAPTVAGRVFFVELADGAKVKSPVHVKFGLEGMTVAPAGTPDLNTGHHHLIVDGAGIPAGSAVPKDDTHLHFGKGQTETDLALTPGEHTLTLQLADGNHLSFGEAWSATIKLTVEP